MLARMGKPALPALAKKLSTREPIVRLAVLFGIGKIADKSVGRRGQGARRSRSRSTRPSRRCVRSSRRCARCSPRSHSKSLSFTVHRSNILRGEFTHSSESGAARRRCGRVRRRAVRAAEDRARADVARGSCCATARARSTSSTRSTSCSLFCAFLAWGRRRTRSRWRRCTGCSGRCWSSATCWRFCNRRGCSCADGRARRARGDEIRSVGHDFWFGAELNPICGASISRCSPTSRR